MGAKEAKDDGRPHSQQGPETLPCRTYPESCREISRFPLTLSCQDVFELRRRNLCGGDGECPSPSSAVLVARGMRAGRGSAGIFAEYFAYSDRLPVCPSPGPVPVRGPPKNSRAANAVLVEANGLLKCSISDFPGWASTASQARQSGCSTHAEPGTARCRCRSQTLRCSGSTVTR